MASHNFIKLWSVALRDDQFRIVVEEKEQTAKLDHSCVFCVALGDPSRRTPTLLASEAKYSSSSHGSAAG